MPCLDYSPARPRADGRRMQGVGERRCRQPRRERRIVAGQFLPQGNRWIQRALRSVIARLSRIAVALMVAFTLLFLPWSTIRSWAGRGRPATAARASARSPGPGSGTAPPASAPPTPGLVSSPPIADACAPDGPVPPVRNPAPLGRQQPGKPRRAPGKNRPAAVKEPLSRSPMEGPSPRLWEPSGRRPRRPRSTGATTGGNGTATADTARAVTRGRTRRGRPQEGRPPAADTAGRTSPGRPRAADSTAATADTPGRRPGGHHGAAAGADGGTAATAASPCHSRPRRQQATSVERSPSDLGNHCFSRARPSEPVARSSRPGAPPTGGAG